MANLSVTANEKNVAEFISLILTNRDCLSKWVADQQPAIEQFTEKPIRALLQFAQDHFKRDGDIPPRLSWRTHLDTLGLKKIDRMQWEQAYTNSVMLAAAAKPANFTGLRDAIVAAHRMEQRRVIIEKAAEALKTGDDAHLHKVRDAVDEILAPQRRTLKKRNSGTPQPEDVKAPPILIEGLLRKGEIANLVSSPKMRKSYAVADLAFSISTGSKWLGHFQCQKAKVLLLDNELHAWQVHHRLDTIREAKRIAGETSEDFDFIPLRTEGLMNIDELLPMLENEKGYDVIILDALYRFFPDGFNENDNAAWTRLYNRIDEVARRTGAAFVIVHHASKGPQNNKSTADSGSGAGAQSRAADAHIVLKPPTAVGEAQDDAPDKATLSAVVRSFAPVERVQLAWNYPCWTLDTSAMPADTTPAKAAKLNPTVREFVEMFAGDIWESRGDIEQRARTAGLPRDLARDLFKDAMAEHLDQKAEKRDRQTLRQYRKKPAAQGTFQANIIDLNDV